MRGVVDLDPSTARVVRAEVTDGTDVCNGEQRGVATCRHRRAEGDRPGLRCIQFPWLLRTKHTTDLRDTGDGGERSAVVDRVE